MKISKIFIGGIVSTAVLCTLGIAQTAHATVNIDEFNTLTRQWTDACYLLGTGTDYAKQIGSAYPNRLFNDQEEAYNTLFPYAYTDQALINRQQGFAATGQTITLNGAPIITEATEVVSGSETLTNNTSSLLNMESSSTQVTTTNEATVNTISAYNLGVTDKLTFEIPAVVSNDLSFSFTYDFSNSNTQSLSTSESVTLPSQSVPVKPGHSVEVDYVMKVSKGTGNIDLNGELSGTSVAYLTWFAPDQAYVTYTWYKLGKMLDIFEYPVANGFTKVSDSTVSHKGGSAQYSTTYYTDIKLRVQDLTDGTTSLYEVNK